MAAASMIDLKIGDVVTNDELQSIFGVGNMGGMRRMLIPRQAAHRFRDDGAHPFRSIVAKCSD